MELKHLNAQEFETILQSGQPAMIDFSAVWCGPCQILAPVMEKLAEHAEFSFWEKYDETHTVVRIATSWGTTEEELNALIELI